MLTNEVKLALIEFSRLSFLSGQEPENEEAHQTAAFDALRSVGIDPEGAASEEANAFLSVVYTGVIFFGAEAFDIALAEVNASSKETI